VLRRSCALGIVIVVCLAVSSIALGASQSRFCWPGFTIPAVTIPAVTIPAVTIPAVDIPRTCFDGTCYPAQHYPAQHYPAQHYPAQHYPAQHYPATCLDAPAAFSPGRTTVRVRNYQAIDRSYSPALSTAYWNKTGPSASYPNITAPGFGELNAAGFPKNQYVRPYVRRDGTLVNGYWRNSPSDGLPTCRVIKC
jgi:hypothetical protein